MAPPAPKYCHGSAGHLVFQGTIYENIGYGKEAATREEVIAAARRPAPHYIMRLRTAMNVIHEDWAAHLPKRQKQLLTIARAMLYHTTCYPGRGHQQCGYQQERQVQKAMRKLMRGKTPSSSPTGSPPIQNCGKDPGGGSRGMSSNREPRDPDAQKASTIALRSSSA